MKTLLRSTLVAASITASAGNASAQHGPDHAAIEAVLATYEAALNASETDAVLTLYTTDGVFMPQHSLPSVGIDAIRTAYDGVFGAIALDVDFKIDEIVQIAPKWALARTRSNGFVTIKATGDRAPEANQELFVFAKTEAGAWRIARYIFSTTNPPRQ